MRDREHRLSRRKFLASAAGLTLAGGLSSAAAAEPASSPSTFRTRPGKPTREGRKPLAVIATVYRPLSHAYHIAGRFLDGYPQRRQVARAAALRRTRCSSIRPQRTTCRGELAREYDFRITRSIAEALTHGTDKLAVEGVLLIGEHGNYPRNDKGQILYPRYELMEEIVAVFRKTGQTVPVFNDKHLSYSWPQAKKMVGWSPGAEVPVHGRLAACR